MIDATQITNYDRNNEELIEFWLFSMMVANKSAKTTSQKLENLLQKIPGKNNLEKIIYITQNNLTIDYLKDIKSGQYNRLQAAFIETSQRLQKESDYLKKATPEELETIPGVGPKTARFFILHSRKDAKIAVLDTHILKWLHQKGHKVPKASPTGNIYADLEKIFLKYAEQESVTPAELDLAIWNTYSKQSGDKDKVLKNLKEIVENKQK